MGVGSLRLLSQGKAWFLDLSSSQKMVGRTAFHEMSL